MNSVIVAVPCYNEAATIAKVVTDFRAALPDARIVVIDNNSSDRSVELARGAGADVIFERRQGKGFVMQTILERLQADALVIVDGDDTYPASEVNRLLEPIWRGEADMTVGTRLEAVTDASMFRLNQWGNRAILRALNLAFGSRFLDVLSGYRALSRRHLSHVPLLAGGFETEVELTIQSKSCGMVIAEVPVSYRARPEGSQSKLRPFRDGYRIIVTIAVLLRDHRPLAVFGACGAVCLLAAGCAAALRFLDYAGVSSLPTSLLSGLVILMTLAGLLSLSVGLVLNSINTRFRELSSQLRRPRS